MKRFSIVSNGYNIEEVNNFIDIVIKKLEKLSQDNSNMAIGKFWHKGVSAHPNDEGMLKIAERIAKVL